VSFGGTIGGAQTLTVSGGATFGGGVSIARLEVTGTTALNGGSLATTGDQSYDGATSLGADTVLTGVLVSFDGTLDGAHALTVTGDAHFGGAVGSQSPLTSVAVTGTSVFNGASITTTGNQSYAGAGTLGVGTVTFATAGGAVTFGVLTGAGDNLTVNLGNHGALNFDGQVGSPAASLGALSVSNNGTTGGSFTIAPGVEVYVATANIDLPGGVVDFGATLNTTGAVTVSASTITGEIEDQSFLTVINGNSFIVNGTVGGSPDVSSFLIFSGIQPVGSFNGQAVGASLLSVAGPESGTFEHQSTLQVTGPLSQALNNPGSLAGEINPANINPAAGPACSPDNSGGSATGQNAPACQPSPDATFDYANSFLAGSKP
jgi:hypothetical protein